MAVNTNAVFSAFSFMGFVMSIVPLYWHIEAWNVGTCMYMIWTALSCLNLFINSVVWDGNVVNWAPGWCDVSTRIIVGVNVAIPTAAMCISRRLYHIVCADTVVKDKRQKRREVIVDLSLCIGIPVIQMLLEYVVEGHRFDIFEDIGCWPDVFNTYLTYPLVWAWPLAIGLVSSVYCSFTLRAFFRRRKEFMELLQANQNLTFSRYLRLMCLACADFLLTIPLTTFAIYRNAATPGYPVFPWISWDDTHFDYSSVYQYPLEIYGGTGSAVNLQLSRWSSVICAIIFFAFFGFADEAKKHYRSALSSVAQLVGYTVISDPSSPSPSANVFKSRLKISIPYHLREREMKGRSVSSLSDNLSTSIYISDFSFKDDLKGQNTSSSASLALQQLSVEDGFLHTPEPAMSGRKPSFTDTPKSVGLISEIDIV